jgi:hypothetical protein
MNHAKRPAEELCDLDYLLNQNKKPAVENAYGALEKNDSDGLDVFTRLVEDDGDLLDTFEQHILAVQAEIRQHFPSIDPLIGWPWTGEKYAPEFKQMMVQVLVVLFGEFVRNCVGAQDDDGEWVSVELFMPIKLVGKTAAQRAMGFFMCALPGNNMVYTRTRTHNIHYYISEFVTVLRRVGVFQDGSPMYLVPGYLFSTIGADIELMLLGDEKTVPRPTGGIHASHGYGVRSVQTPVWHRWAVGEWVMETPSHPYTREEWVSRFHRPIRHVTDTDDSYEAKVAQIEENRSAGLPRIRLVAVEDDADIPSIPEGRYYPLDEFDQDKEVFEKMVETVNGTVETFASLTDRYNDDECQQWLCGVIVNMLSKWCPNFMSVLGAQYAQRVCLELQDPSIASKQQGRPRAYFAMDERYKNALDENERRVIGTFVDVYACLFFSAKTYLSGFVGTEGTGKDMLRDLAVMIAGGTDHEIRLDADHDRYSFSMLKNTTFLATTEDGSDGVVELPAKFMGGFLGGARGTCGGGININAKYGHESLQEIHRIGCYAMRNEPPKNVLDRMDLGPYEQVRASIVGSGGGKDRRVKVAPPAMIELHNGTANPVDEHGDAAFRDVALRHRTSEIAALICVLWAVATIGDVIRDDLGGLAGEDGNENLDALCAAYLGMKTRVSKSVLDGLIQEVPPIVFEYTLPGSSTVKNISMAPSVSVREVKKQYNARSGNKNKIKELPASMAKESRVWTCASCMISFGGTGGGVGDFKTTVPIAHAHCTALNKDELIRTCPANPSVRCFENLQFKRGMRGYRFREVDAGDN